MLLQCDEVACTSPLVCSDLFVFRCTYCALLSGSENLICTHVFRMVRRVPINGQQIGSYI
uniref:Uncharacterized protein n=1 Tax=Anguilla anguilla TaxID=7936 RepID=A0A0E9R6T1_ANGAN